jgi:FkbM family methyltransferase
MNPLDLLGPSGFYVEAGANDGISQSCTFVLEKRGWEGLLIEPNKGKLAQCRASRSNTQNTFEHCALVSFEYEEDTICGNFAESEVDTSLVGQITIPSKHWDDPHRVAAEEKAASCKIVDVPARTLQSLLDEHNIEAIDYLALDVEGYEYEAMDGLDFKKNPPRLIRVETSKRQYRIDAMTEYLLAKGYRFLGMANLNDCLFGRFR